MENMPYIAESMAFEINFYQMMFGASQMSKENENYEVNPYKTIDYNMNEEKFKRFMEKVIIEYNNHKNNSKKQSSQYDDMYFNILTSPYGNVYVNILNDYKDEKANDTSELIQEIKTMYS